MFSILPSSFFLFFSLFPSSLTFLHVLHPWPSSYPLPLTLNMQILTTGSVWPTGVTLLLHRTQATLSGHRRVYGGVGGGGGGGMTLHSPSTTMTWETRAEGAGMWEWESLERYFCLLSVCLAFPSIYSVFSPCAVTSFPHMVTSHRGPVYTWH